MTVTSDATDAYQLANANVGRVDRTLIYLKPDILLVLDRVDLKVTPATVEARFQVYNDDGRGTCSGSGQIFRIERPFATLQARSVATTDFATGTGKLNLPAKEGLFPYAAVMTVAATSHSILTVCTAAPAGESHGTLAVELTASGWRVHGSHRGQKVEVGVNPAGEGPPAIAV